MGRFTNDKTGVTVSVDDSKDERFATGWSPADEEKAPSKKAASDKSEK